MLLPIVYPRPKAVSTRLITAIKLSIVIIGITPSCLYTALYIVQKPVPLEGHMPSAEGEPPTVMVLPFRSISYLLMHCNE